MLTIYHTYRHLRSKEGKPFFAALCRAIHVYRKGF